MTWERLKDRPEAERLESIRLELAKHQLNDERIAESYSRLLGRPEFVIAADRVAEHLRRAGDPSRAALALEEAVESLEDKRGDASALFVDSILRLLLELTGSSARAARLIGQDPMLAIELGARFDPHRQQVDFNAAFSTIRESAKDDTERYDRAIRRYRHRQMLRIALREIRDADVRDTAEEIADLAAAALDATLEHHHARLIEEVGAPDPPCAHVVVGMGKLGGRELNFSSDIDIIFVYEHDQGGAGKLSMHEFHVKLVERVIASLSRLTSEGFVFRVDMDLRPEGKRGPLANSVVGAERYYETWGRTWERAAWVRGQPVAGDPELGKQVLEMIRPFVWRRSFDLRAIEEIAAMKSKIDSSRRRRLGSEGFDLKLGLGGIREVEFFVQAQQLLHGGRQPRLRAANTLVALQRLEAHGLVNARMRETLANAYLLFRKVEHRIQIVEDQQTHTLPTEPTALNALARSLGFASGADLDETVRAEAAHVHEIFLGMMELSRDDEPVPEEIVIGLDSEGEENDRLAALVELGAEHPYAGLSNLDACGRHPRSPFHPRASGPQRRLARRFLHECAQSPSFDRALNHLPDFVRSAISHRQDLGPLARPNIRRGVARVLGASDLLSRILVASPELLSEVLLGEKLPTSDQLLSEISARVREVGDDTELVMLVLRILKQEETLRTALADLADQLTPRAVGLRLSALADALIEKSLQIALEQMIDRYGVPMSPDGRPLELVVIGGGTLGAREMGYRTDLDLSAVYEGAGETTGGPRGSVSAAEFFTRTVQRLLPLLTMRTQKGDLYPVDLRLRPSGSQGPLVVSLSAFESYHRKASQLWERQALVRTRTVAGPTALRERVDAAIAEAAYGPGPAPDQAATVRAMRGRLQTSQRPKRHTVDLKHGEGGLIELEFLVQHLLLSHGGVRPELRTTSTRDGITRLAASGVLPEDEAEALVEGYDRLRRAQNWVRLMHDEMIDQVDLGQQLRGLALCVGYEGEEAELHLVRDLQASLAQIHESFVTHLSIA